MMNERMKELLAQATGRPMEKVAQMNWDFELKFAELIVAEATDVVYKMLDDNTGAEVVVAVKEHFGVEQ